MDEDNPLTDFASSLPMSTSSQVQVEKNIKSQFCDTCQQYADETEKRYKKTFNMIKKKVIFTDNLIRMYTKVKSNYEDSQSQIKTLKQEISRKDAEIQLIETQLKAVLSDKNSSEIEELKKENEMLSRANERLNDQIKSVDMTTKMLDDKIVQLKEELLQKEVDWKKHTKEKDQLAKEVTKLKKAVFNLERSNSSLNKKNEVLLERVKKRRSRASGSFSQTTDSEHNATFNSEEAEEKVESEIFKSPLPEKKKKLRKRHRRSTTTDVSEDDEGMELKQSSNDHSFFAHISSVPHEENEVSMNVSDEVESQMLPELSLGKENDKAEFCNEEPARSPNKTHTVVSEVMKHRLLEKKRQRAQRCFSHHPNALQLNEMKIIVDSLPSNSATVENEITKFSKKHHLDGYENQVVKKIIKLHQTSLDSKSVELLQQLFQSNSTNDSTSSTKRSESIENRNKQSFANAEEHIITSNEESHSETADSKLSGVISKSNGIEGKSQSHDKASTGLPGSPLVNFAEAERQSEATKNHVEEIPTEIQSNELLKSPSIKTQNSVGRINEFGSPAKDIASPTRVDINVEKANKKSSPDGNKQKQPTINKHDVRKVDDEQHLSVEAQSQIVLTSTKSPKEKKEKNVSCFRSNTSHVSAEGEIEDSISNVCPPNLPVTSDSVPCTSECPIQLAKTSNNDSPKSVEEKTKRPNHDTLSSTEDDSNDDLYSSDPSKLMTSRTSRKRKKVLSSAQKTHKKQKLNTGKRPSNHKSKTTIKDKAVEDVIPCAAEIGNKGANISSAMECHVSEGLSDTTITSSPESSPKKHPVLSNMKSLPFSVGSSTPRIFSPKVLEEKCNFLHENLQVAEEMSEDSMMESFIFEEYKNYDLNDILFNMTEEIPQLPLSPLRSNESDFELVHRDLNADNSKTKDSTAGFLDGDLSDQCNVDKADEDSRPSISPSANLCTAMSFSSSTASPAVDDNYSSIECVPSKIADPISHKEVGDVSIKPFETAVKLPALVSADSSFKASIDVQKESLPSNINDTPRRFSCEAPVLARSIPTIKPVCKAHSLDPSLLGNDSSNALSYSAKRDANCPEESADLTPQKVPESLNMLTHISSGPFKVFSSTSSPDKVKADISEEVPCIPQILSETQSNSSEDEVREDLSNEMKDVSKSGNPPDTVNKNKLPLEIKKSISVSQAAEEPRTLQTEISPRVIVSVERLPSEEIQLYRSTDDSATENVDPKSTVNRSTITTELEVFAPKETEVAEIASRTKPAQNINITIYSSQSDLLQSIHSFGIPHSNNKMPSLCNVTVVKWLVNIIKQANVHGTMCAVDHLEGKVDIGNKSLKDFLPECEYQFIMMAMAVDEMRLRYGRGMIESTLIPGALRLLCRYGKIIPASSTIYRDDEEINNVISPILAGGFLTINQTTSLVRIFVSLCRLIGFARGPVDLCRFVFLARSFMDHLNVLYDCIACYPAAFSKHYPLSGKIVLYCLRFQSEKRTFDAKPEGFKEAITSRVDILEHLLGWHDDVYTSRITEGRHPDARWKDVFNLCMANIQNAELLKKRSHDNIAGEGKSLDVISLSVSKMDDVFFSLEFLLAVKSLPFLTVEVIDKKFWPWLNSWSRHLATSKDFNRGENEPVTDACMMATLHGLATVLLVVITRQHVKHPNQPVINQVVAYFETICALLRRLTTHYSNKVPQHVQCCAAVTVLKLHSCNSLLAYTTVHEWLTATSHPENNTNERKGKIYRKHPFLPQILALYQEKSLKKNIRGMEDNTKSKRKIFGPSLTALLWG